MAIVILWGLLSSTALDMVLVPALYLRFGAARASGASANAGLRAPASRNVPMRF
jgi:hypothetical protein